MKYYAHPSLNPDWEELKMTLKQLCFSFEGRINRRIYWSCMVGCCCCAIVMCVMMIDKLTLSDSFMVVWISFPTFVPLLLFLGTLIDTFEGDDVFTFFLVGPPLLILFYVSLAATVKRLHDTNRSGWHVLIGLIPFIGTVYLSACGLIKNTDGENAYGPPVDKII